MEDNNCGLHCTKINNISVKIGNVQILKNVNIHIHCGELTVLIGPNGAGKTTLLKALLGEIPHTGTIQFIDKKENKTKNIQMGYVPQSINIEKHMPVSVYDLCGGFFSKKPVCFVKDGNTFNEVKKHLKIFGADHLINKQIGDLSGGELQRVLLSIATYPMPNLLILDEPVSGIDRNGINMFFDMIYRLKKECDMAIILVSHDLYLVEKYADKVILLDKEIIKDGTPREVFKSTEFENIFGNLIV